MGPAVPSRGPDMGCQSTNLFPSCDGFVTTPECALARSMHILRIDHYYQFPWKVPVHRYVGGQRPLIGVSGCQVALPTEETGTQITQICTSRTVAATRQELRHIGGSRLAVAATRGEGVHEPSGCGRAIELLRRCRWPLCKWHAGRGWCAPGRSAWWCADRRERRLPARRGAGLPRRVRRR
jgi:hypothetical protein